MWKNQKNVDNDMQNIFIENPLSLGQLSHQLTHHHESHKHPLLSSAHCSCSTHYDRLSYDVIHPYLFFAEIVMLSSLLSFQSLIKKNTDSSREYLSNLYPRLKLWYNWFNKTQAGPLPYTYR